MFHFCYFYIKNKNFLQKIAQCRSGIYLCRLPLSQKRNSTQLQRFYTLSIDILLILQYLLYLKVIDFLQKRNLMKSLERYSILVHIIGWLIFITVPLFALPFRNIFDQPNLTIFVLPQLFTTSLLIIVFYLNLNVLIPNLLSSKNGLIYVLYLIICFVILFAFNSLVFEIILRPDFENLPFRNPPPKFDNNMPPPPMILSPRVFGTVFSYILVVIGSWMLALVRERTRGKEENQQIILEKTAAELAVLKLQISPHFLFNTLNNIRWLARQKSDKTEDAVVKLSQLLRYMIYQTSNDKVPLLQEVEHLQNYIDLQKMRLTENSLVEFKCEGDMSTTMIEPLLFIPFVENAFKYGLHNQEKSLISISIKIIEKVLVFSTENNIFENTFASEKNDSGIGIKNVERRLALHYPDQHELKIEDSNNKFKVSLTIKLA
jgi:sensor histidine kinase YesM